MSMELVRTETCERVRRTKPCGKPAPHLMKLSLDDGERIYSARMCDDCAAEYDQKLTAAGFQPAALDRTEGKVRAAYVAASGRTFTGEDARAWLVERELARERGRIARSAIQTYAANH